MTAKALLIFFILSTGLAKDYVSLKSASITITSKGHEDRVHKT